jgi:hypothetical protein
VFGKNKPPNNTKHHEKKHKQIPLRLRASAVNRYLPQRRQDAKKGPRHLISFFRANSGNSWFKKAENAMNTRMENSAPL